MSGSVPDTHLPAALGVAFMGMGIMGPYFCNTHPLWVGEKPEGMDVI